MLLRSSTNLRFSNSTHFLVNFSCLLNEFSRDCSNVSVTVRWSEMPESVVWTEDRVFEKNASSGYFVLEVSRVGSMLSTIESLFLASKVTIFRQFALLTKKLMLKSPHSICLSSGSIGKVSKKFSSL